MNAIEFYHTLIGLKRIERRIQWLQSNHHPDWIEFILFVTGIKGIGITILNPHEFPVVVTDFKEMLTMATTYSNWQLFIHDDLKPLADCIRRHSLGVRISNKTLVNLYQLSVWMTDYMMIEIDPVWGVYGTLNGQYVRLPETMINALYELSEWLDRRIVLTGELVHDQFSIHQSSIDLSWLFNLPEYVEQIKHLRLMLDYNIEPKLYHVSLQ